MNDVVKEKNKMGRKVTLTPDKIIETIKELQNDKRDVTPCTIRKSIGSGGLGNISSVLQSYLKEQRGISLSESEPQETHILPPALEDKLNMILSDLSQQLNNFSLESDQLATNIAEKKARSAYENIIQHNQQINGELTLTIKIFDEIEVKNDEMTEQITEIQIMLENEQIKSSALDASLSKANDESTRLNLLVSETKVSLSTSETKNKSLEKLITKAETRLEGSITDKEIAVKESIKTITQLTQIESELLHAKEHISQLQTGITQVKSEAKEQVSEIQNINSNLMTELNESKEKLISTTTTLSAQKELMNEKDKRIVDLVNQRKAPVKS
ncbi:MAG: hypothetical protein HRT51_06595 [Colwellia sp.]|nr:hypothetical protein [Colwellia sp.]